MSKDKSEKKSAVKDLYSMDEAQLNAWRKTFRSYYARLILIDKKTGEVIPFSEKIKFDDSTHYLSRFVKKEVIQNCEFHNESETMGYIPGGVATIKLHLYPQLKFYNQNRRKDILHILNTFGFIQNNLRKKNFEKLSLSDFYQIGSILNKRCLNSQYEPFPLTDTELEEIADLASSIYLRKEFQPACEIKNIITVENFAPVSDLPSAKSKKNLFYKEMFALIRASGFSKKENISSFIKKTIENLPDDSQYSIPEYSKIVAENSNHSSNSIRNKLYKMQSAGELDAGIFGTILKPKSNEKISIEKILNAYIEEVNLGKKPTQESISKKIDVSVRTISKNWKRVKEDYNKIRK